MGIVDGGGGFRGVKVGVVDVGCGVEGGGGGGGGGGVMRVVGGGLEEKGRVRVNRRWRYEVVGGGGG
uniref:Uncharacterized protein n=1 Tax=Knipowitschia caucasica TaxID=637954 RepID=A0AAV2M988_KNICA